MLVGRDGGTELRLTFDVMDVLAHDHGVVTLRERVAGVHDGECVGCEQQRGGLGGAEGVGGPQRDAIHRRRVEGR